MSTATHPTGRFLRPNQAAEKLGIGLSTLWLKIKNDPDFPTPIKTGPRTTVLVEAELDAYVAQKRLSARGA